MQISKKQYNRKQMTQKIRGLIFSTVMSPMSSLLYLGCQSYKSVEKAHDFEN